MMTTQNPTRGHRASWLFAVVLAVFLAACGSDGEAVGTGDEGVEDGGDEMSDGAVSGDWTIEEISVDGALVDIPTGAGVTLVFSGDQVSGRAACNSFSGTYLIEGERLVTADLAATAMGCEPELSAIEAHVLGTLGASPRLDRSPSSLVLSTETVTLRYEPTPPVETVPLTGTEWGLTGFIDGETATTQPGVDRALLVFLADGNLGGNAGCNALNSSWTVDGDSLTFGEVALTRMSCSDEANEIERRVVAVLGDADRFEIEGNRLLVWAGDRALDLVARSASAG